MSTAQHTSQPVPSSPSTIQRVQRRVPLARLPALCVFLGLGLGVAFVQLYTTFGGGYDDEGYFLLALKQFIAHGSLYRNVYTQYGPFTYELWDAIYRLLGLGVTQDSARMFTLILWVGSALLCWLTIERISGSTALGLVAGLVGFAATGSYVNEPMYPGGVGELLLFAILAVAILCDGRLRVQLVVIGALLGAVVMTKINLGLFVVLATCMALAVSVDVFARRRWVLIAMTAVVAIVPWALMRQDLGKSWAENFALVMSLSTIALAIALSNRRYPGERLIKTRELALMTASFVGALLVIAVILLALGSRPGDLIQGEITGPLAQSGLFTLPIQLPAPVIDLAFAGVALAAASRLLDSRRTGSLLTGVARVAVALFIWLWVSNTIPVQVPYVGGLGAALPLGWLAAQRPLTASGKPYISGFARAIVAALPIVASLIAFPVAGTQLMFASALFTPAAGLILWDGLLQLRDWQAHREPGLIPQFSQVGRVAAWALAAALAYQVMVQPLISGAELYAHSKPLPFRGSTEIRIPASRVNEYVGIVDNLLTRCATFITLPGMNTFYLWTGEQPPTGLNAGDWLYLLNSQQQQRIVNAVQARPDLCLLSNPSAQVIWEVNDSTPVPTTRPLWRFTHSGWKTIYTTPGQFGYQLAVRSS